MPLQVRRGTETQRTAMVEPLASGELLYVTNTGTLYIGNGTTLGGTAVANLTEPGVKNIAGAMFTGGTHTGGISFVYDGTNVNATVDVVLSNYQGVIRASSFNGSLVADDSMTLVDALIGKINLDGTVKGNIVPDSDSAYDIGSAGLKFRDLYLSGTSLHLGNAVITATGSTVQLPAGSTVGGVAIGAGSGDGVIDGSTYKINIAASDSSLMVNTDAETVTASGGFIGDLSGNAGTVTNGVYTNGSYADPTWITSIAGSKVSGSISGNAGSVTNGVYETASYYNPAWITALDGSKIVGGPIKSCSIFGDDSSIILDSTTNRVIASKFISANVEVAGQGNVLTFGTTASPGSLRVIGDPLESIGVYSTTAGFVDGGSPISFYGASGTPSIPTKIVAEGTLGAISFNGYNGTVYKPGALMISSVVAGTDTAGDAFIKTNILFATSDGVNFPDLALTVRHDKVAESPCFKAIPFVDASARTTAIAAPEAGMVTYLTSINKLQAYNGAAWVDLH